MHMFNFVHLNRSKFSGIIKPGGGFRIWPLLVLLGLQLPCILSAQPKVSDMSWLSGTWTGVLKDGSRFEAIYSKPDGGMILGMSRQIWNERKRFFEFELFTDSDSGQVLLKPYPAGKSGVTFVLDLLDDQEKKAVFRNPSHDFPRELTYHAVASDSLIITASGEEKGKQKRLKFGLRR